jgi:hypothetical protein
MMPRISVQARLWSVNGFNSLRGASQRVVLQSEAEGVKAARSA